MELLVASSNPHKVEEIRAVLAPLGIAVIGLGDLDLTMPPPAEDADTFEGNAQIKARAYAAAARRTTLADDSGIEVDALGGAPGVYSARYAGVSGDAADQSNNEKLLHALEGIADAHRTARFVCAMCLCDASGTVLAETRGVFEGVIAHQPRGGNGFGYDPLLYLPDDGCTSAELPPAEKNARSHRGEAARKMAAWIAENLKTVHD